VSRIAAWLASPHRFPTSSLYVPRHARPANIARRSEVDLQQSAKSPQEFQQQSPAFLDSRGLAYLRQSNYDKAIADYDAALRLRPKIAWSLYGRGLARQHKGMTAEARADIDAATALQPQIADMARKYGIGP